MVFLSRGKKDGQDKYTTQQQLFHNMSFLSSIYRLFVTWYFTPQALTFQEDPTAHGREFRAFRSEPDNGKSVALVFFIGYRYLTRRYLPGLLKKKVVLELPEDHAFSGHGITLVIDDGGAGILDPIPYKAIVEKEQSSLYRHYQVGKVGSIHFGDLLFADQAAPATVLLAGWKIEQAQVSPPMHIAQTP